MRDEKHTIAVGTRGNQAQKIGKGKRSAHPKHGEALQQHLDSSAKPQLLQSDMLALQQRVLACSLQDKPVESLELGETEEVCEDIEQRIVNFVCAHAVCGKRGRLSSKPADRRVLLIGQPYYWDYPSALSFDEIPDFFRDFIAQHGLGDFNSILCNVYEQKKSKIGQHQDDVTVLADGSVISVSFARDTADRYKRLANMLFTSPHGVERVELRHGMEHAVCFDAFEDKSNSRAHEVSSTLWPRVNLTFRKLNPTKSNMYQLKHK
mmetsp:Transcript_17702/g.31415  ORF Transcript_17702/g.31415 Transcript_17702/m.31415 type:complete len:264 (-) Transcript_17702:818-1609(-)